jgi:hypothetical protein
VSNIHSSDRAYPQSHAKIDNYHYPKVVVSIENTSSWTDVGDSIPDKKKIKEGPNKSAGIIAFV